MAATVLVHHVGSLGDTIVTMPALRAVRAEWPDAEIVMLHNRQRDPHRPGPAEILKGSGLVDRFVGYERDGGLSTVLELWRVWRTIRAARPDVVAYVGPSERSRAALARDRRFYTLAGAGRVVGFLGSPRDAGAKGDTPVHEAGRKLARLAADGVSAASDPANLLPPFFTPSAGLADAARRRIEVSDALAGRLVAVAPESQASAKRWNQRGFESVGRELIANGWYPIAMGGEGASGLAVALVESWGGGAAACGWAMPDVIGLLATCRAYVGVDSGLAHLAAAVGVRCVVIAGGHGRPGQWEPLGDGHRTLRHPMPCAGCGLSICSVPGHPCMQRVTVADVIDSVRSVLRAPAP